MKLGTYNPYQLCSAKNSHKSSVCDFVLLVLNLVLIHQSTQSRFHTIIHFYSALFIFSLSLSKTKAQLSLCLYTLQMNAYPCKFLKKKG